MEGFSVEGKSDRHRKKRFYNGIRSQVEFYLGDVNLTKDRFFSRLLEESPYIDIDVILKCNKIKKLTSDPNDIVKALKKSSLLSVTEDGTKLFRTVPVNPVINADDCTIYVEDLPIEADHEWLKNVFGKYGEVVYVSIPLYKTSHKIKGFAFVQFDSPETASKALNAFQSVNACLSCSLEPAKLRSVQTYEGEKDVVVREHAPVDVSNIKCVKTRRTTESEDDDGEPQRKKRKKTENGGTLEEVDTVESVETHEKENIKEKNTSTNEAKDETVIPEESKDEDSGTENRPDEHKTKKNKRKKAKKSEQVQTYGMQILSKKDWKKLRNKYLEEQRNKMHELKQQLKKASIRQQEKSKSTANPEPANENVETVEPASNECRFKFIPGVIVKLSLDQPVKDVRHFKNEVKRYADVEYIDVNKDDSIAYVRCSSNEAANQVIALNKWQNMSILQGSEELTYWEKIKQDRKEKFENKIHTKTRGKNKLIKKVEAAISTHIKFPD